MGQDRFITTRWSLIEGLRSGSPEEVRRAQEALARVYWGCVLGFVAAKVRGRERAEELTQRFFVEVVLGRRLFEKSERREGSRLRSLVYSALRRFLVDVYRQQRGGVAGAESAVDAQDACSVEASFYRGWCADLLTESLRRCEKHYESRGKTNHWKLFEAWVIWPRTRLVRPGPMDVLASRHGFASAAAGSAAVQVVSLKWRSVIREVVAETVDPEETESELAALRAWLG